jgi:hypothetical protein
MSSLAAFKKLPGLEKASDEEIEAVRDEMYAAAELVVRLAIRSAQRPKEAECHSTQLSIVESPQ